MQNHIPLHRLIIRKIKSANTRFRNYLKSQSQRRIERTRLAHANEWLKRFAETKAEVLVGANFVDMGGCRQHMHNLVRFSSLKSELVPDEALMECRTPPDFSAIHDDFLATPPSKHVLAVHSHVFPWLIKWCIVQRQRIPVWVHTHHAWYFDEYNNGTPVSWHTEFNHYFTEAIKNCDIPLCVSRWQQRFMEREFGLKTNYVPNGVDLSLCLRGNAKAFQHKMQMERKFVLWVGRNDPVKNPREIVQLAFEFPELPFYLVGPGLSPEAIQADYGISTPKNVFYTGRLSQAEVQDAIAACSTLVVTSRREGLPTLVLEGLAHQKPIVVPNEDGCVEALGGEDFGQIYELGNISSLKLALDKALSSPPCNPKALQRVRDEFDWPVIMRRLDRVYKGGTLE